GGGHFNVNELCLLSRACADHSPHISPKCTGDEWHWLRVLCDTIEFHLVNVVVVKGVDVSGHRLFSSGSTDNVIPIIATVVKRQVFAVSEASPRAPGGWYNAWLWRLQWARSGSGTPPNLPGHRENRLSPRKSGSNQMSRPILPPLLITDVIISYKRIYV